MCCSELSLGLLRVQTQNWDSLLLPSSLWDARTLSHIDRSPFAVALARNTAPLRVLAACTEGVILLCGWGLLLEQVKREKERPGRFPFAVPLGDRWGRYGVLTARATAGQFRAMREIIQTKKTHPLWAAPAGFTVVHTPALML